MNHGARKAVLVSALIALLLALSGPAFAEDTAAIDRLFKEAKGLWERGRADEAAAKLKELLAQDPSQETAYDLLRKAEYQMFLDLLTKGGDAELVVKRLMELAHLGEQEKMKDDGAIAALVEQAVHGSDYGVREKAVRTLVAKHGEYAVPALVPFLGSNDRNDRVYAVLALSELSSDAVLPLIEVLRSDNWRVQQNAAAILGKIGDVRAIGGLSSLAATAQNAAVKEAAAGALAKIKEEAMQPVGAYLRLAKLYFAKSPKVIKNYLASSTIWDLKDGKLVDRQVPNFLYNLELAEEACFDALAADPKSQMARSMLTAVHYAEWGAVAATEGVDEDLKTSVHNVLVLAASQGPDTQLGALSIGLKMNDGEVARGALGAIPKVWDGRKLDAESPLVMALDSADKTVRFAAATALLMVDPGSAFPGSDKVMPIAGQAAATGSMRQVLVIEPNAELRAKSLRVLEAAGMYPVAEATGTKGMARALDVAAFDAIVMRYELSDSLALAIVKKLQSDFRTEGTPILITGNASELDEAKNVIGERVQGYLAADPLDADAVKSAADTSMNDDQMMALAASLAACQALAGVDTAKTAYSNYATAEAGVAGVLGSDKPDANKMAALAALSAIGSPKSAGAVTEVFSASANMTELRVAAAQTLGAILNGKAAPAAVFDALLNGLGDESVEVRAAAGDALGEMKLTAAQQNTVLTKYRVQ